MSTFLLRGFLVANLFMAGLIPLSGKELKSNKPAPVEPPRGSLELAKQAGGHQKTTVPFPDPNLQALMRTVLSIPSGPIDSSDLIGLTSLDAHNQSIIDLTGLESCIDLEVIDLSGNYVKDTDALAGLPNLSDVTLDDNAGVDLAGLAANTDFGSGDSLHITGIGFSPNGCDDLAALLERGVSVTKESTSCVRQLRVNALARGRFTVNSGSPTVAFSSPEALGQTVVLEAEDSADGRSHFDHWEKEVDGTIVDDDITTNPLTVTMYQDTSLVAVFQRYHTADTDEDWDIDTSELDRVQELFEAGAYHCGGGDDGFATGSGSHSCTFHDADIDGDWQISLTEFLRVIELAHGVQEDGVTPGYHQEWGSEDGYSGSATPPGSVDIDRIFSTLKGLPAGVTGPAEDCDNAPILSGSFFDQGSTKGANGTIWAQGECSPDTPTLLSGAGPEVVYGFSSSETCDVEVLLTFFYPALLDLYIMESDCSAGHCIAYGQNTYIGSTPQPRYAKFTAQANVVYYFVVDTYADSTGDYLLSVNTAGCEEPYRCAANPHGGADTVGKLAGTPHFASFSVEDDTRCYNDDYAPPAANAAGCTGQYEDTGVGPDVVYAFESAAECDVVVTLTPTDKPGPSNEPSRQDDLALYISTDPAFDSVDCALERDALGRGGTETITFTAAAATIYYIVVDGYGNDAGPFKLDVVTTGCTDPSDTIETEDGCTGISFDFPLTLPIASEFTDPPTPNGPSGMAYVYFTDGDNLLTLGWRSDLEGPAYVRIRELGTYRLIKDLGLHDPNDVITAELSTTEQCRIVEPGGIVSFESDAAGTTVLMQSHNDGDSTPPSAATSCSHPADATELAENFKVLRSITPNPYDLGQCDSTSDNPGIGSEAPLIVTVMIIALKDDYIADIDSVYLPEEALVPANVTVDTSSMTANGENVAERINSGANEGLIKISSAIGGFGVGVINFPIVLRYPLVVAEDSVTDISLACGSLDDAHKVKFHFCDGAPSDLYLGGGCASAAARAKIDIAYNRTLSPKLYKWDDVVTSYIRIDEPLTTDDDGAGQLVLQERLPAGWTLEAVTQLSDPSTDFDVTNSLDADFATGAPAAPTYQNHALFRIYNPGDASKFPLVISYQMRTPASDDSIADECVDSNSDPDDDVSITVCDDLDCPSSGNTRNRRLTRQAFYFPADGSASQAVCIEDPRPSNSVSAKDDSGNFCMSLYLGTVTPTITIDFFNPADFSSSTPTPVNHYTPGEDLGVHVTVTNADPTSLNCAALPFIEQNIPDTWDWVGSFKKMDNTTISATPVGNNVTLGFTGDPFEFKYLVSVPSGETRSRVIEGRAGQGHRDPCPGASPPADFERFEAYLTGIIGQVVSPAGSFVATRHVTRDTVDDFHEVHVDLNVVEVSPSLSQTLTVSETVPDGWFVVEGRQLYTDLDGAFRATQATYSETSNLDGTTDLTWVVSGPGGSNFTTVGATHRFTYVIAPLPTSHDTKYISGTLSTSPSSSVTTAPNTELKRALDSELVVERRVNNPGAAQGGSICGSSSGANSFETGVAIPTYCGGSDTLYVLLKFRQHGSDTPSNTLHLLAFDEVLPPGWSFIPAYDSPMTGVEIDALAQDCRLTVTQEGTVLHFVYDGTGVELQDGTGPSDERVWYVQYRIHPDCLNSEGSQYISSGTVELSPDDQGIPTLPDVLRVEKAANSERYFEVTSFNNDNPLPFGDEHYSLSLDFTFARQGRDKPMVSGLAYVMGNIPESWLISGSGLCSANGKIADNLSVKMEDSDGGESAVNPDGKCLKYSGGIYSLEIFWILSPEILDKPSGRIRISWDLPSGATEAPDLEMHAKWRLDGPELCSRPVKLPILNPDRALHFDVYSGSFDTDGSSAVVQVTPSAGGGQFPASLSKGAIYVGGESRAFSGSDSLKLTALPAAGYTFEGFVIFNHIDSSPGGGGDDLVDDLPSSGSCVSAPTVGGSGGDPCPDAGIPCPYFFVYENPFVFSIRGLEARSTNPATNAILEAATDIQVIAVFQPSYQLEVQKLGPGDAMLAIDEFVDPEYQRQFSPYHLVREEDYDLAWTGSAYAAAPPLGADGSAFDLAGYALPITRNEFRDINAGSYGASCVASLNDNACERYHNPGVLPVLRAAQSTAGTEHTHATVLARATDPVGHPLHIVGDPALDSGDISTIVDGGDEVKRVAIDVDHDQVVRVYFVPNHISADYGDGSPTGSPDLIVDADELDRAIFLYNEGLPVGGIACENSTADGYAVYGDGSGLSTNRTCEPYTQDYNPHDWELSLSEVLRVIQFYNSLSYHYCPADGTEDGFCPGT